MTQGTYSILRIKYLYINSSIDKKHFNFLFWCPCDILCRYPLAVFFGYIFKLWSYKYYYMLCWKTIHLSLIINYYFAEDNNCDDDLSDASQRLEQSLHQAEKIESLPQIYDHFKSQSPGVGPTVSRRHRRPGSGTLVLDRVLQQYVARVTRNYFSTWE